GTFPVAVRWQRVKSEAVRLGPCQGFGASGPTLPPRNVSFGHVASSTWLALGPRRQPLAAPPSELPVHRGSRLQFEMGSSCSALLGRGMSAAGLGGLRSYYQWPYGRPSVKASRTRSCAWPRTAQRILTLNLRANYPANVDCKSTRTRWRFSAMRGSARGTKIWAAKLPNSKPPAAPRYFGKRRQAPKATAPNWRKSSLG